MTAREIRRVHRKYVYALFLCILAAAGMFFSPGRAAGTWNYTQHPQITTQSMTLLEGPGCADKCGMVLMTEAGVDADSVRAKLYDPATEKWTETGRMIAVRHLPSAALLQNGQILITGATGYDSPDVKAELYSPTTGDWTRTLTDPDIDRVGATATVLRDGRVLVAGGGGYGGPPDKRAEIYDPRTGMWEKTPAMVDYRVLAKAALLEDGRVLVSGGQLDTARRELVTASAEIYDPRSNMWSATGTMLEARAEHGSVKLQDGRVLVAGGHQPVARTTTPLAEIFDPRTGVWAATGPMLKDREYPTLSLLPGGKAMAVGGSKRLPEPEPNPNGVELYDPGLGVWTPTDPVNSYRRHGHFATLLPPGCGPRDLGAVLVAGGEDSSAELYDLAPKVTGVAPSAGPDAGGTEVAIAGRGLNGTSAVKFGEAAVAPVSVTDRKVTAVTPPHSPGTVDVRVVTAEATSQVCPLHKFTFDPALIPPIGDLPPAHPLPAVSVDDVSMDEGNTGDTPAVFNVRLSAPAAGPLNVDFASLPGSAGEGDDFRTASGRVAFQPGETTKTIDVAVVGDTKVESDESFFIRLSEGTGFTVSRATGRALVRNDDQLPPAAIRAAERYVQPADRAASPAGRPLDLSQTPSQTQVTQPQAQGQSQMQAAQQAEQAQQVVQQAELQTQAALQPAMMVQHQRQIELETETADGGKPGAASPYLAASTRLSGQEPALLAWAGPAIALGLGLMGGQGQKGPRPARIGSPTAYSIRKKRSRRTHH